jgi:hypothetical protein
MLMVWANRDWSVLWTYCRPRALGYASTGSCIQFPAVASKRGQTQKVGGPPNSLPQVLKLQEWVWTVQLQPFQSPGPDVKLRCMKTASTETLHRKVQWNSTDVSEEPLLLSPCRFLPDWLLDSEHGSDIFLRNVSVFLLDYKVLYTTRYNY